VLFGTLVRRGAKLVSISELAERPQYGFTASAALEPVGPKFVRITDLQDGKIDWDSVPFCECAEPEKCLLQDDDLLFARTGATTGKTHLVKDAERAVFASYLIRLRPKPGVFAGYLHAFFQSDAYWTQISDEKEGSAQPNVNGEKLAALQIPHVELKLQHAIAEFLRCVRRRQDGEKVELPELPSPLAEQRRVVARIEELAAQIHEARTLRHQAAEEAAILVPSGMAGIFKKLGEKYPTRKLEALCDVVRGGSPRPAGSPLYYGGDIPFMKVGDLTKDDGMYLYEASASVNELGRDQSRFIEADTLMLTNSGATLGVPKITKISGCFNDGSQAFLNVDSSVSKEYLYYLFKSKTLWFREQLARGQGQPNLNTDMTKQLDVPVPPLAEQRRIVAELDALQAEVDALKRLQAETAAELDALLPSILDRAFKGEL
jgi:type I restriction enzyme, S subunit